jgi:voltage-gated potassium channel
MEPERPLPPRAFPSGVEPNTRTRWQAKLYEVIFGHHTRAGRQFDVALILAIALSVGAVMMESVASIRAEYGIVLRAAEWAFTLIFTVEYVLRLLCVRRPSRYATSFFGVIDLLAILPTYLSLFVPGAQFLLVIRTLRFLRIFRILKLVQYLSEANVLGRALWASRRKILVFLLTVITLDIIFGSLMYVVEGAEHGFDSIPRSIYWAIVTLTTVGYGDISPGTNLGQLIAALIMITGYAIIAVPTGIVTAELTRARPDGGRVCRSCGAQDHTDDAVFCRRCAARLPALHGSGAPPSTTPPPST